MEFLNTWLLPIILVWLILIFSRTIMISSAWLTLKPAGIHLPLKWLPILTWGGLRGALAMMLALSIPRELAEREMILALTFGIVVISILGQGLTIAPLLNYFNMISISACGTGMK